MMDVFFKAVGSAVWVMLFFFVAIIGGSVIAAKTAKTKNARQAITGLAALVIFTVLFFTFRK